MSRPSSSPTDMLRIAIAIALAGVAAAASTLDVDANGSLRVTRQLTTTLSDIDVRIAEAVGDARVAAGEAAHNATQAATLAMTAQMFTMQTQLTSQMTAVNALLASQGATMSTQLAASESTALARGTALEETLTSGLNEATQASQSRLNEATQSIETAMVSTRVALTASISSVSSTVVVSINRTRTAVDAQITNALAGVASTIVTVNRNVSVALAGKADADVHMWTGGCRNHGHSGWQEYCLNQVHVNSAAPKFRVQTASRFQALVAGYYAINYWVAYKACSWQYQQIFVAGSYRVHGYQRQGYHESGNSWRDAHAYLHWPVTAGQQMWGRSYSGCWNTWHSTNGAGAHSRITVVYAGTIA